MIRLYTRKYGSNTNGNLSIITGVVGTLLLTAVGAAFDGGLLVTTKAQLQSITDAAALSAATPETAMDQDRRSLAMRTIESHGIRRPDLDLSERKVYVAKGGGTIQVDLSAEVPLLFGALLGGNTRRITATSIAKEDASSALNSVSISIVLDLSDSMQDRFDRGSRIASVKAAVSDTFSMIEQQYGGDVAAQAQVSTGLYPFNLGGGGQ